MAPGLPGRRGPSGGLPDPPGHGVGRSPACRCRAVIVLSGASAGGAAGRRGTAGVRRAGAVRRRRDGRAAGREGAPAAAAARVPPAAHAQRHGPPSRDRRSRPRPDPRTRSPSRPPPTSTTAWPTWASRWRSTSAGRHRAAGGLRRARHLRRRRQPRPAAAAGPRAARPASSAAGRAGRTASITVNRPLRRGHGGSAAASTSPLIVMNCSYRFDPPNPPRAPVPRGPRPAAGHGRSSCTTAACSRDRGIEQLIEAIPARPGAALVLHGLRRPGGRARAPGGRTPALGGRVRVLPAVPPGRAARLGRVRRRRRDADPAVDPQPPPDDAEQALRGDGGRRPGRRQRPARDGRDRARDRVRRARATRRIPPDDRAAAICGTSSADPASATRVRPPRARRRRTRRTTGRRQAATIAASPSIRRLTGQPW